MDCGDRGLGRQRERAVAPYKRVEAANGGCVGCVGGCRVHPSFRQVAIREGCRACGVAFPIGAAEGGLRRKRADSPDGRWIAFIGRDSGSPNETRRLWLQALDAAEASLLPDTEGAADPVWAPDSRQLVFRSTDGPSTGMLRRLDMPGGAPQTLFLCFAGGNAWGRGGVMLVHDGIGGTL